MMKNTLIVVLACLALLGASIIVYQNNLQQEAKKAIESSIIGHLEYRLKAEDAIKREMEGKKREREFILRQENERQLKESLDLKLPEYKEELEGYRQQLQEQNKQVAGYKIKLDEYRDRLEQQKREQIAANKQLELAFNQQLDGYRQQLSGYKARLSDYAQQLQVQARQLAEYEKALQAAKSEPKE